MSDLPLDIFINSADRFAAVEAEVLKTWHPACGCPTPGSRLECASCPCALELGLLIQKQLATEPEAVFPAIELRPNPRIHAPDVKQRCIEMYQQGYPLAQIRQETGVSSLETIRRWAKGQGLPGRTTQYAPLFKQACIELYIQGKSTKEIAQMMGAHPQAIAEWTRNAGVNRERRFSDETKQKCLSLYTRGKSLAQIEQLTGVEGSNVRQ